MEDQIDTVTMDIPLLLRVLEHTREEVKSDTDLHRLVTSLVEHGNGKTLTIEDFDGLIEEPAQANLKSNAPFSALARLKATKSNN